MKKINYVLCLAAFGLFAYKGVQSHQNTSVKYVLSDTTAPAQADPDSKPVVLKDREWNYILNKVATADDISMKDGQSLVVKIQKQRYPQTDSVKPKTVSPKK